MLFIFIERSLYNTNRWYLSFPLFFLKTQIFFSLHLYSQCENHVLTEEIFVQYMNWNKPCAFVLPTAEGRPQFVKIATPILRTMINRRISFALFLLNCERACQFWFLPEVGKYLDVWKNIKRVPLIFLHKDNDFYQQPWQFKFLFRMSYGRSIYFTLYAYIAFWQTREINSPWISLHP